MGCRPAHPVLLGPSALAFFTALVLDFSCPSSKALMQQIKTTVWPWIRMLSTAKIIGTLFMQILYQSLFSYVSALLVIIRLYHKTPSYWRVWGFEPIFRGIYPQEPEEQCAYAQVYLNPEEKMPNSSWPSFLTVAQSTVRESQMRTSGLIWSVLWPWLGELF